MATKPTPGASAGVWGTEMNAFLDVGHDADGTHTKSQMLTDMGWNPTAFVGAQSITFPNGFILKIGEESVAANTTDDVTYGAAFPTAFVVAFLTVKGVDVAIEQGQSVQPKSGSETSILQITNGDTIQTIYWVAIGY